MATRFVLKQNLPKAQAGSNPTLGEYIFDDVMFTVGSDAANNLVLAESASEQAVVVREADHLTLINSAEGTLLNGQNLRREAINPLANGDEIRIGNYIIHVVDEASLPFEKARQASPAINGNTNGFAENEISHLQPEEAEPAVNSSAAPQPSRNFADILNTMRTEEDSFYFTVKNGVAETGRFMLEHAETPIGADGKGGVAFAVEQISTLLAVARKDWSGILLESQRRNSVFVNDEAVETARRLQNDDLVSFAAPTKCSLVLHEPSSLVALESMLSARVASGGARYGGLAANSAAASENALQPADEKPSLLERRYFGHFSFIEIVTMVIGTLIGAVLFFLFFEFTFS